MIRIRVLGPADVSIDDRPAPAELLWRKPLALLIYLALAPRRTRTREHLLALLWADKPEKNARHALNEELSRWRRTALGDSGFETDATQVRLAPGIVRLDLDDLNERVEAEDWEGAAAIIGGEFLEKFEVKDAAEFDDWLVAERRTVTALCVMVLLRHGEQLLAAGDCRAAAALADRARALDLLHQSALRLAMRALALAGDRALALRLHDEARGRLAETLSAEPEAATDALAARIRSQREWQLPLSSRDEALALPRQPLIGRDEQLGRALRCWKRSVTERRAGVVVIDAEEGLGKTRLLEEITARVGLEGAALVTLRAVEADAGASGSVLLGLARGGLLEAPGVAAAQPDALAAVSARVTEWADRFPGPPGGTIGLSAALIEIFRAAAEEGPLVLAIDDAQWADGESLQALTALIRDLADLPVLLIIAARPRPLREELELIRARIGHDLTGDLLTLGPLDTSALEALVRWRFPAYTGIQVGRLARRLAGDSAGVPFVAVELLQAVALGLDLESGEVWPEAGRTNVDTLPAEIPPALVAAIRIRFWRLSPDAREVLKVAGVLGGPIDLARLSHHTGLSDLALTRAVDEAEWVRWLIADSQGYDFTARILREVIARDLVLAGQRQRIREADASRQGSAFRVPG